MIIFIWFFFAILIGVYAKNKKIGLGGLGAFILSVILSPIIGFLIVLLSKPSEAVLVETGDLKKCPQCAELIKNEALKCRYCGADVSTIQPSKLTTATQNMQTSLVTPQVAESAVVIHKESPSESRQNTIVAIVLISLPILVAIGLMVMVAVG